jgi:isoquinoline 1-oxidoreductase beta subunit
MLSRRGFILSGVALGGGLVIAYGFVALDDGAATDKFAATGQRGAPLNAWLKIAPDGTVICGIHRAEMGQGITTTLAMLLAEELDANWADVRFEFVPVDRDYFNFGMLMNGQPLGDPAASWRAATGTWAIRQAFHALGMSMTIASSSTIDAWDTLRPAGAAARQMLLAAAARQWGASIQALHTEHGYVVDATSKRRLSYGALAEQAASETPPASVQLKNPADYTLIGHNPPRLDTPMKVDGTAVFGMDVRLADMLHATVVHSPVAGSKVASFATNGAENMPGVHLIVKAGAPGLERAVAVIADNSWQALQAAQQIIVTPSAVDSQLADSSRLAAEYKALLDDAEPVIFRDTVADAGDTTADKPDFDALLAGLDSSTFTSADYAVPFLAHVCMEPMNCTALYTGDALEIWAPTQASSIARDIAAKLSGLDNDKVTLHSTFIGGGFGRRAEMDFIEQAVSVALQLPDRPVKLFWSREQDIRHDAFRPAATCRIRGGLDSHGRPGTLDYKLVTQSVVASYETRVPTPRGDDASGDKTVIEAVNPPIYPLQNLRIGFVPSASHMPAGFWRSVAHSWTTFFVESFIDELATTANIEPLEFRRRALADRPRHLQVLNTLMEALGRRAPLEPGHGIGYAIAESHATVVAHAVEVSTDNGIFARVKRVVCVVDCGPVVHPDNVIAQMEGSIIDGLSAALYGQVAIRAGCVEPGNFNDYPLMRLEHSPAIEVHLIASKQRRPGGVGEPGLPGVAPALCNAIHAATRKRIRTLPVFAAAQA